MRTAPFGSRHYMSVPEEICVCVCVCVLGGVSVIGGLCPGDLSFQVGLLAEGDPPSPWTEWLTDRCKNFVQTSFASGNKTILYFCLSRNYIICDAKHLLGGGKWGQKSPNHPVTRCLTNPLLPAPNQTFCGLQMWSSDLDTSNPTRLWVSLKLKIPWPLGQLYFGGGGVKCRYANFTLRLVDYHNLG